MPLEVMVVKLATSEPLRKAHLRLQSEDDKTRSVTVVTDENGLFESGRVEPGRYNLTAMRVGYVSLPYAVACRPSGAILTLRPGQRWRSLFYGAIGHCRWAYMTMTAKHCRE